MKKLFSITAIILTVCASLAAQDSEFIREWERTTWRVSILLDDSSLDLPAVQFAVFRSDPVPGFTKNFREFSARMKADGKDVYTDEISMLSVTWDSLFAKVTGDDLYLLVQGEANVLSSNDTDGRIWLVTKSSGRNGEPLVWVIPVDVKTGTGIDVKLTEENCTYLKGIK